jgi:hypothetical protein
VLPRRLTSCPVFARRPARQTTADTLLATAANIAKVFDRVCAAVLALPGRRKWELAG